MRAVVQRVSRACVTVDGHVVGRIGPGLLVYAAAAPDDAEADVAYIAEKVVNLRIFPDAEEKMNLSVGQLAQAADPQPRILLVSAFTVLSDARKGRRPSFDASAPGAVAEPLMEKLVAAIRAHGLAVETGRFAACMQVDSVNDGPICILVDSRRVI